MDCRKLLIIRKSEKTVHQEGKLCLVAVDTGAAIAREIADITIEAEDLGELLVLRDISKALMRRIDSDYRLIITLNSMLILLGAFGIITPAASATLHNLSTLGISIYNMTDLIKA